MTYSKADRELDQMVHDMRVGLGLGPCGTGMHVPENIDDTASVPYGERDPEGYAAAQRLRAELISKISRSPRWVQKWYASRSLDARIEALCERKGLRFKPWEPLPWWPSAEGPALRLRKRLIAELEAADAAERQRPGAASNLRPLAGLLWAARDLLGGDPP